MPKPKIPNQKKQYRELNARLDGYMLLIERIYEALNLEAAKAAAGTDYTPDAGQPFRWSDYPQTRKRMEDIQARFVNDIGTVIYRGTSSEWKRSNAVQDLLADKVLKFYNGQVDGRRRRMLYQDNSDALKAFQRRREKGMSLSRKLWNQSESYKNGLEKAISCAIEKGISAVTLSKRVSRYLNDFPSLRKDYGERFGKATDILDCEYRSMRLARSEINMAYRTAENERWEQMDFIVGYEIKLSGNHNCRGVRKGHFSDICDTLAGKYPKDFKWVGWHPNCRCYKIPILKTEDEFFSDAEGSVNEVKDVPEEFRQWVGDNVHRAKSWSNTPYFIRDNKGYVSEDFKVGIYSEEERSFVRKRRTNAAMSHVEYYNKIYPDIPEVQQAAVNAYTQPVGETNKGATSREINRRLRNDTADDYVNTASELISQCLKRMPKYEGVAYRGETMSANRLKERFLDHVGEVVSDKGFFSSSRYMKTPKKFITHDGVPKSHRRVIFEIQSKNGRDISRISEFNGIFAPENQYEILFDKRTKFYVSPDIQNENGILRIKLIEQ